MYLVHVEACIRKKHWKAVLKSSLLHVISNDVVGHLDTHSIRYLLCCFWWLLVHSTLGRCSSKGILQLCSESVSQLGLWQYRELQSGGRSLGNSTDLEGVEDAFTTQRGVKMCSEFVAWHLKFGHSHSLREKWCQTLTFSNLSFYLEPTNKLLFPCPPYFFYFYFFAESTSSKWSAPQPREERKQQK